MYVHIGSKIVLNSEEIIAILDKKTIERKENIKINEKIKEKDFSSIIITNQKKETKIIASNISSLTLAKRTQME